MRHIRNGSSFGRALALGFLAMAWAGRAQAQDRGAPEAEAGALGSHQKHLRLDLGARTQFVRSDGLDPFSENDVVPQLSLGASYVVWTRDRLSLAATLGFDYAGLSSNARSSDTSLSLQRFTLGPEARYHLLRILVLTAKVAPTLTRQKAEVSTGVGSDLRDVAWKVGFDATAGVAVEVFGYRSGTSKSPRLWVTAEGGYGWTASNQMVLEPKDEGAAPERFTPLELRDLSLSGPLFKIGAALSF